MAEIGPAEPWRIREPSLDVSGAVTVTPAEVTAGPPVEIGHHGEPLTVSGATTRAIPPIDPDPEPASPRPPERRKAI